jgi:hypothetical protein
MLTPTAASAARVPLARAARPALAAAHAAPAATTAASAPARWLNFKLFDNIIPEDDPETKERKDRERRIVKQKMQRSKFADMFAAQKGKNLVATADVLPPAAERLFPALAMATPIADGSAPPLPLPASFAQRPLTLVTLAFQAMGQEQLRPWQAAFMERFAPGALAAPGADVSGGDDAPAAPASAAPPAARAHPSAQPTPAAAAAAAAAAHGRVGLLNIVYLEGWAWKALGPLVRGGMARALPPGLAPRSVMVLEPSEKATDVSARAAAAVVGAAAFRYTRNRTDAGSGSLGGGAPSHCARHARPRATPLTPLPPPPAAALLRRPARRQPRDGAPVPGGRGRPRAVACAGPARAGRAGRARRRDGDAGAPRPRQRREEEAPLARGRSPNGRASTLTAARSV